MLNAAMISVLTGQPLRFNCPRKAANNSRVMPPTAILTAPNTRGAASFGANAWVVPVVPHKMAASKTNRIDIFILPSLPNRSFRTFSIVR